MPHSSPPIPPAHLPKAGRPIFGDYQVEGELGRGGMGVVFRARQKKLNRLVALKMLTGHYGPDELARFRAEAETAASLRHTNIVQIYEVGEDDGAPFFSMEYIETGSLADRLRGAPLPPREGAQLLISVARALHFAHENGVVHRDMKPANVLLDRDGVPKVTDFGIAKRLSGHSALTLSGAVIGTPTYMAPEQAKGTSRDVGAAADVYSLGAILYEMLAGRPPFLPEDSETALALRVITEDPVSPAWHRPGIPRELETICMKCLEKEPPDRYPSAAAFAEDLRRFLEDESIVARPPTTVVRTVKWIRRHPWRSVAALVAAAALVTAGQRLWQWEFYQRSHLEYAAAVDFLNGGLEPAVQMGRSEAGHAGVNLRLTRRGRNGPVTLVEVVNSHGNPAVLRRIGHPDVIPIYIEGLMGAQPNTEKTPETVKIQFKYDGSQAVEATGWDRNGNVYWRLFYYPQRVSDDGRSVVGARFANLRGFQAASLTGASHMEIERDARGRDLKVSFFDGSGQPSKNGEGVYAYKMERDEMGRTVRLWNLGQDGKPAPNRVELIALAFTLNSAGRRTLIEPRDADGKAMVWNDIASSGTEYDAAGNAIRLTRLGADGKLARISSGVWAVHEMPRNDRGEMTAEKFFKAGSDGGAVLESETTLTYDEFGHPATIRSGNTHLVMQHDQNGNMTEEKYLDAEGHAIKGEKGYAIKRVAYYPGPNGLRWEETFFDANGAKTYGTTGYHRLINEFNSTGELRRQTLDEHDPARFKYYRYVGESEFDRQGRTRHMTTRFEDEQGQLVDAAKTGLPCNASEDFYDEAGRLMTEWMLGCDLAELGAPVLRTGTEYHRTGARKRRIRQACDIERKPVAFISNGNAAHTEEEYNEIDRLERISETGFDEKLFGFSTREAKFSGGTFQSVVYKRTDGTALESVLVFIKAVLPEQPKAAELHTGDQLLEANGKPVPNSYEWATANFPGGWIEVMRDGKRLRIEGFEAGLLGLVLQDYAPGMKR